MYDFVEKILVTKEELNQRIGELGREITAAYPRQEELLVIGILRGAVPFMAALVQEIDRPLAMDFMSVSSYGKSSRSSGVVRILKDLEEDIEGKHILIVEDIIDTGLTLSYLVKNLRDRGARSIRIATLLDKPERRVAPVEVNFTGFQIPDEFVIGFGLDYAQRYRNLPFVAALKRSVYEKEKSAEENRS